MDELAQTVKLLLTPPKGILAADESLPTIEKRFKEIGIESTEDTRRAYRELLLTTEGIEEYISGVILFDETIKQKTSDGRLFVELLTQKGIVPGIKVDEGMQPYEKSPNEKVTKGLDGLPERLKNYRDSGAKFTKWRAAFTITDLYPSKAAIEENMHRMAEYAKFSQQVGLVPIVEPEVLMDGNHTTTRCGEITRDVLQVLFRQLEESGVNLTGILLKVNMVLPGRETTITPTPLEVAGATVRTLKQAVPDSLPGVVFLSGGQSPEQASANLNEIAKTAQKDPAPWELGFSYARALQAPAMRAWGGKQENVDRAQKLLLHRARMNSLARMGKYTKEEDHAGV